MRIRAPLIFIAIAGTFYGQMLEFEVASVKSTTPPLDGHISTRMSRDDRILNYSNVTLKDLIGQAYGVAKFRISGPDWLDTNRYTIAAKLPAGTTGSDVPAMFQTLLKDRFGLVLRWEMKDLPVLALSVEKGGAKMTPTDKVRGCHTSFTRTRDSIDCEFAMADLSELLSGQFDRPVVDETLLQGAWRVQLEWSPDGAPAGALDAPPPLRDALSEKLGLKLEPKREQIEVLVVAAANPVPTDN